MSSEMPFALILIATALVLTGIRGKYKEFGALLAADFSGPGNFFNWLMAVGVVGCIGYVPALEKFSRVFIALIILKLFISDGGFFSQFLSAFQTVQATPSDPNPGLAAISGASSTGIPAIDSISGAISGVKSGITGLTSGSVTALPGIVANSGVLGSSIIPPVGSGVLMGP